MSDLSPRSTPAARWDLPDRPSLDWLRGRAKQLRRAYADPAAERHAEAVELVATYDPPAPDGAIALAQAQRVLARAFGFAGWKRLREHVAAITRFTRLMEPEDAADDAVSRFLRLACLSYTEPEVATRAVALLHDDSSLATANVCTLAATGRAHDLAVALAADPGQVDAEGGPHAWPPLLYLCYSRLGLADAAAGGDPLASLRVLLDAGADPNAGFLWKGFASPFTALTGVLGGGERDEPPHPEAVPMAELLLAAGADPNDNQALYNRMFAPDDSHLGPLLARGAGRPHPSPWRDRLGTAYPSAEEMVGEHLRSAAEKGFTGRVRLLLEHGVDPNTIGYHPILGDQTAYEIAVRNGHEAAEELLRAAGGHSERLDDVDRVLGSALAGRLREVRRRFADDPALLAAAIRRRPDAVRLAAESAGLDVIAELVELGFPVDGHIGDRRTALHEAALEGDTALCRWLVEHGADRTIQDRAFSSTPAGWAEHGGHSELAAELGA